MILDKKEATLAYRCPYCGDTVTGMVGIFALSGDMIKLKCHCGESELTITYTPDRKMRITVPCIACPQPHHYVLGQNTFFARESGVFRLPCSYSGIDICFIGGQKEVSAAVEQSNDELIKLMQDAGLNDLAEIRDNEDVNVERDPQVEEIVRFALLTLNDEGKIKCECQNNAIAHFDFNLGKDSALIYCEECGASARIPMHGLTNAYDFLDSDGLTLTTDGGVK